MDFDQLNTIPPVTRTILLLSLGSIALVSLGLVHPLQMLFSPTLVFQEKQYWRLLTNFFFFGRLNFNTIIELHWLYTVSSSIELQYFGRRRADYCFTLFVGMFFLLVIRSLRIVDVPFLSSLFSRVLVYLFSRLLPDQEVNLFALITIQVRLLPFIFLFIAFVLEQEGSVRLDAVAIFVGHILWYLLEIFPRITRLHPLRLPQGFLQ